MPAGPPAQAVGAEARAGRAAVAAKGDAAAPAGARAGVAAATTAAVDRTAEAAVVAAAVAGAGLNHPSAGGAAAAGAAATAEVGHLAAEAGAAGASAAGPGTGAGAAGAGAAEVGPAHAAGVLVAMLLAAGATAIMAAGSAEPVGTTTHTRGSSSSSSGRRVVGLVVLCILTTGIGVEEVLQATALLTGAHKTRLTGTLGTQAAVAGVVGAGMDSRTTEDTRKGALGSTMASMDSTTAVTKVISSSMMAKPEIGVTWSSSSNMLVGRVFMTNSSNMQLVSVRHMLMLQQMKQHMAMAAVLSEPTGVVEVAIGAEAGAILLPLLLLLVPRLPRQTRKVQLWRVLLHPGCLAERVAGMTGLLEMLMETSCRHLCQHLSLLLLLSSNSMCQCRGPTPGPWCASILHQQQ